MLLELAALLRESFTKMLYLILWNRHTEHGGDPLKSQDILSWHKPSIVLCQTSRSYWKTEVH